MYVGNLEMENSLNWVLFIKVGQKWWGWGLQSPIPTFLPLSGYVRARYSLATLGFKCQEKQNKQVEKLKRGQKQRVSIIRVVNNEKIC